MTESGSGLPGRPEAGTGLPRPPRAPLFGIDQTPAAAEWGREVRRARCPAPPPGRGPVLGWYRSSWTGSIRAGIAGLVLLVVVFAVLSLTRGDGLRMLTAWWIWLLIVLAAAGIAASTKVDRCAVGADWFMHRKTWVDTYELTDITTRIAGGDISLVLTDAEGRRVDTTFRLVHHDRDVWDYLYNGIRHSIAGGAELHGTARRYFRGGPDGRGGPGGQSGG